MSTPQVQFSRTFRDIEAITNLFQTIHSVRLLSHGLVSGLIGGIGHFILTLIPHILENSLATYMNIFAIPSEFLLQRGHEKLTHTYSNITLLTGIAATTYAAYKFHERTNSLLIKGAILGLHNVTTSLLTYANLKDRDAFVLREGLESMMGADNYTYSETENANADVMGATAFLISNIATTYLFSNPILGTTTAYITAAATYAISLRLLRASAVETRAA